MPYPCSDPSVLRVLRTIRLSVPGRTSFLCCSIGLLLRGNTSLNRSLWVVNISKRKMIMWNFSGFRVLDRLVGMLRRCFISWGCRFRGIPMFKKEKAVAIGGGPLVYHLLRDSG